MVIQVFQEFGEASKLMENFLFSKLQEISVLEAKNCFQCTPIGAILADMLKSTVIYIFLL